MQRLRMLCLHKLQFPRSMPLTGNKAWCWIIKTSWQAPATSRPCHRLRSSKATRTQRQAEYWAHSVPKSNSKSSAAHNLSALALARREGTRTCKATGRSSSSQLHLWVASHPSDQKEARTWWARTILTRRRSTWRHWHVKHRQDHSCRELLELNQTWLYERHRARLSPRRRRNSR